MFRQALIDIVGRLEKAKHDGLLHGYGLIGGLAVSAWSQPRATSDIDFAVVPGSTDFSTLSAAVGGLYRAGGPDDPLRGVFTTTSLVNGQTIPIQLIVFPPRWTQPLLNNLQHLSLFDLQVAVVSWQALILLKLYAGGPQDLIDAREILNARRPHEEMLDELRSLAEGVGLSKELAAFTG